MEGQCESCCRSTPIIKVKLTDLREKERPVKIVKWCQSCLNVHSGARNIMRFNENPEEK